MDGPRLGFDARRARGGESRVRSGRNPPRRWRRWRSTRAGWPPRRGAPRRDAGVASGDALASRGGVRAWAPRRAFLWQISPRLQREGCDVVLGRVRLRSGEDGTRDGVGAGMRVGARRPCQLPAGCHVLTSCGKVTSTARARTRGAARGGSRARGLGLVRIREGAKRRGRVEARRVEGSAPPTLGTPASRPARNSRRFAHLCSRKPASRRALAPPGAPRPDELTSPSFTWNRGRGATDISPHVFALPAPPRRRTPPGGCSRGVFPVADEAE